MMAEPACPVCGGELDDVDARNALSRVRPDDQALSICEDCGNREAVFDYRANLCNQPNIPQVCLYADDCSGIMWVTEDEPGYSPFGERPKSPEFAQSYCDAWNSAIGLSDSDVNQIVHSSMFGRWVNF